MANKKSAPIAVLDKQTAYSRLLDQENTMTRRYGMARMQRYRRNWEYYIGENLPPDNVEQPLHINLVNSITNKHVFYLFGQWKKSLLNWSVTPEEDLFAIKVDADGEQTNKVDAKAITTALQMEKWIYKLCETNSANLLFSKLATNASIYGDAILRIDWIGGQVKWTSILPEHFHAKWNPSDPNIITEVIVAYPIPRAIAFETYGTSGNPKVSIYTGDTVLTGVAMFWEHWTQDTVQMWIDDIKIQEAANPYIYTDSNGIVQKGIIPFVTIPNLVLDGELYGYSDVESAFYLQDELNRRVADEGDIINNNAHPITLLNRFTGEVDKLDIGPDSVWDMGREGEAKYLEWTGSSQGIIHEYLDRIWHFMMEMTSMTDIAFGIHQGSQRSGASLAVQMLPIIERVMFKRAIWDIKLNEIILKSLVVAEKWKARLPFAVKDIGNFRIEPVWSSVLPKDRLAVINENVALFQSHLRSLEECLSDLGDEDVKRHYLQIIEDLKTFAALGIDNSTLGGSQKGSGGSNELPQPKPLIDPAQMSES